LVSIAKNDVEREAIIIFIGCNILICDSLRMLKPSTKSQLKKGKLLSLRSKKKAAVFGKNCHDIIDP
jgi:hypothetical protein